MEFLEFWKQKNKMCLQKECDECMTKNSHLECPVYIRDYPEEAEKYVKNWVALNPIKTNQDKFEEIFHKHLCASHNNPGYFFIHGESMTSEEVAKEWLLREYEE